MKAFCNYLNTIKAEATLKDETKNYVRAALAETSSKKVGTYSVLRRENFQMKKMIAVLSSIAACAVLVIGGFAYYDNPVNYVSLDINPSVEFGINAFDRVVSAEAYNEDGTQLLEAAPYINLTLEEAVDTVVQEAVEQGFIMDDGSTVIAVTAESNEASTATELQTVCESGINLALETQETSAIIYVDCVNLQLRTRAREAGVSPGKYRLIEVLQSCDSNITIEQYKNSKITNIITAASEILSGQGNGQTGEYAGALERIRAAAQKVLAANGFTEQERNQNQNSETTGVEQEQEQEQEENQNSGAAGVEQEQNQNSGTTGEQEQEQNQNQNSGTAGEQEQNQNPSAGNQSGADISGQNETGTGTNSTGAGPANSGASSNAGKNSSGSGSGSGSGGRN